MVGIMDDETWGMAVNGKTGVERETAGDKSCGGGFGVVVAVSWTCAIVHRKEMMDMTTTTVNALEELLRPFEARPLGLTRDEIAARQRGAAFGEELNRIQGAEPNAVRERLSTLWCLGQISDQEFDALVAEIARRGLFEDNEVVRDGR